MHKSAHLPAAFAELGLTTPSLQAVAEMGFTEPTDVQRRMIPLVLEGRDVLGQARTGTGKTAAFGLPILQMIDLEDRLQAIMLAPTRELAVQVAAELRRLCPSPHLHVVPVYGGQKIQHQLHLLGRKPHVVVGTPGRVIDLLNRRALVFDRIRFAVLDEVDRMLDIGFRDDIRNILSRIKHRHQTVLVSATVIDEIKRLAAEYMTDPVEVDVSRDELTVAEVTQAYVTADPWDKFRVLMLLLEAEAPRLAIVFCNTKHAVRKLTRRLYEGGVDAKEIHGDLVQRKRERIMDRFRRHNLNVLVATDLAARGIDVRGITHIINYDLPEDSNVYVHRIGRTARMGMFGKAISLVTRDQGTLLTEIERLINKEIPQQQMEGFEPSSSPQIGAVPAAPVGERVGAAATVEAPGSRSLGGKFRSARRRRRR
jgi:ATP-dependent RNA helicase DeaD